jgi:mediator of RNA polymerase II transcription subunit 16, fungi type
MLDQTLLVAFATTTKQLRTVRVYIKWGNKPAEKTMNAPAVTVSPSIFVGHLAVTNWMDGAPPDGSDSFPLQSSMATLSHLEILPATPKGSAGPLTLPTIITVRSYLPTSPSHFNQEIHSTIDRWELRESSQAIHPTFELLGSRRRNSGSQPSVCLLYYERNKMLTAIPECHNPKKARCYYCE